MSGVLGWQNPPEEQSRRVHVVADELRSRPGEWALIDSGETKPFPWWGWLWHAKNTDFEVRIVRTDQYLLGNRDVYARYVGATGGDV